MCGIAGVLTTDRLGGKYQHLSESVQVMVQSLLHRGPDGNGVWFDDDGRIALGHTRLSIIDLSDQGKQPMVSRSRNSILTFNGEIYNHVELRKDLIISQGIQFQSISDTEVLLEAIEHWGIEETLSKVSGMFALALWDKKEECLYLAQRSRR